MTDIPLISIIIPTYNRAYIISEALDSVLEQTHIKWECIVVDDGSTDCTKELIQKYLEKDSRFSYYTRPDSLRKGPSACRNYGYEQSKGDYIQWFDSDDVMHPNKLKIKLECALKYQAHVIIDKHADTNFIKYNNNFKVNCFTSNDFYINFILGEKPVITNDVMLKQTIIGVHKFDEFLRKGEEYEFFSRVFKQKLTYCFLDAVLTHYSISDDSISIAKDQSKSLIYLSKKLQKDHSDNSLIVSRAKRQGQKTYKVLIKRNKISTIFSNFHFFKNCYNKSSLVFLVFIVYNSLTKKGFDKIKI